MSGSKTVVNLHSGILHSRKKVLLLFTTAWMELESILLSEVSQAVRDKYHMISPIINKSTKQTSKQNRTRDMEIKKGLLPFMTAWMDMERIMLSEISQAVKDKHHMISLLTGT